MTTRLDVTTLVNNSRGFADVSDRQDQLQRDAGLFITHGNDVFSVIAVGSVFPVGSDYSGGEIRINRNELFAAVQRLRSCWRDAIVDLPVERTDSEGGGRFRSFPFQDRMSRPTDPEQLQAIGARLAREGQDLFDFVFFGKGNAGAQKIAWCFKTASFQRELVITIHSAEFLLPWNLLYTHPSSSEELNAEGSNFQWAGFWGYRHIIEHCTENYDLGDRLFASEAQPLATGVNVDLGIDHGPVSCIAPQVAFFRSDPRLEVRIRGRKAELRQAFSVKPFSDGIAYFCCHGQGGDDPEGPGSRPAGILLTDRDLVTSQDVVTWLGTRDLESNPIFFVNACQGGQITTLFYRTLAAELLQRGARALVGPLIDVPVVFAREYAIEFFRRFLNRDRSVALGPLIRELARLFLDEHRNPLGLIYSLYRGTDCRVVWQ